MKSRTGTAPDPQAQPGAAQQALQGRDVLNRVIRAVSQQYRFNRNRLSYPRIALLSDSSTWV